MFTKQNYYMSYTKRLNSRKVAVHCSSRCGNLPGYILAIRLSWRRWQTQQSDGGWRSPTSAGVPKCPRQLLMFHDDPAAADNFWTSPHAPIAVAVHFSTCRRRLMTASAHWMLVLFSWTSPLHWTAVLLSFVSHRLIYRFYDLLSTWSVIDDKGTYTRQLARLAG